MSNSHAACQCRQNHPNALIVWALWRFSIGTARVDGNVDATLKTWVDRPRSEPLDPSSWIGPEAMDRRSVFLGRRGGKGTETNAPAAHGR